MKCWVSWRGLISELLDHLAEHLVPSERGQDGRCSLVPQSLSQGSGASEGVVSNVVSRQD